MMVLLDAGPLGRITSPHATPINVQARQWLRQVVNNGAQVLISEVADYEVRRGLVLAGSSRGIAELDQSHQVLRYIPITTATMRKAADVWADARRRGKPTASETSL